MNTKRDLPIHIQGVPALEDNYIWIITQGKDCIVVDPGSADPVIDWCTQNNLQPTAILITHTHHDHVDGISLLRNTYSATLPIYANRCAKLVHHFTPVEDETTIGISTMSFQILTLPGHTPDHIGFYLKEKQALFCGDTLFAGGCGRLFNGGTPEQMTLSLQKINQLPKQTALYCAHEYTLANLRFAAIVEPHNEAITKRLAESKAKRISGEATVPSFLEEEQATNPFLRTETTHVEQAINQWAKQTTTTPSARFALLRAWKNELDATGILERD